MNIFKSLQLILIILILTACNNQTSSYTNIDYADLKKLMANGAVLVDIRTAQEWKHTGVIAGSNNLSFFLANGKMNPDFVPQLQLLVKVDDHLIVMCRSGRRSGVASDFLTSKLGYKNVYNVKNGIMGWIKAGYPVTFTGIN
jgi:rhodanese-related sulfurtransferase